MMSFVESKISIYNNDVKEGMKLEAGGKWRMSADDWVLNDINDLK